MNTNTYLAMPSYDRWSLGPVYTCFPFIISYFSTSELFFGLVSWVAFGVVGFSSKSGNVCASMGLTRTYADFQFLLSFLADV